MMRTRGLTTPRVSPRSLTDEDSETLAVFRNGLLTRVGCVASVVATTSSIAIQVVVILESTHSRQVSREFFLERESEWPLITERRSSTELRRRTNYKTIEEALLPLLLRGWLLLGGGILRCLLISGHRAFPPSPVIRPDRFR